VFIAAAMTVMHAAGEHTVPAILGMRVVAFAGIALIARYGPELARYAGVDPTSALWLGLLNPLVLVHFVGGAHNDAVMVGLTVAGLALAVRGRVIAGIVTVTFALLVKAPAGLALVSLVPLLAAAAPPTHERTGRKGTLQHENALQGVLPSGAVAWAAARVAGVAAGTTVAVTATVGLGYGWIHALHTPARARNGLSLSTDVGLLLGYPLRALGLATQQQAIGAARAVGLAAAMVVVLGAVALARRLGPLYALGIALTAVVVLAPVVHPWYLLWGLVPLALSAPEGPVRRLVVVVSAGGAFALMPNGERRPAEMLAGAIGVAAALAVLRLPGLRAGTAKPAVGTTVPAVGGAGPAVGGPGRDVLQRQPVSVDAETADDPGGDRGHHGVVPELLAGVDVGDVHLDEGAAQHGAGVAHRVRIV
jgi:hypothetical protein